MVQERISPQSLNSQLKDGFNPYLKTNIKKLQPKQFADLVSHVNVQDDLNLKQIEKLSNNESIHRLPHKAHPLAKVKTVGGGFGGTYRKSQSPI